MAKNKKNRFVDEEDESNKNYVVEQRTKPVSRKVEDLVVPETKSLDDMTHKELMAQAEARGLSVSGTKPALLAAIKEKDAESDPEQDGN